ncbi:hypothetical protein U1E44_03510 [Arenibacter sp. GZD96]|uniref:hypothetical protein n=1 Tax=Aurantibrevibacter litoralis TaxID=3106030 RepID=UPI002AFDFD38|nr:hypothetical protein [Arenibacter sp. GZD-96]MEA1785146.1 hypothetical protein [Arenibacter sp. GZD-96]
MSTLEDDYIKAVMEAFFKGRGGDDLFPFLAHPSPDNLKRATLLLLEQKRLSDADISRINNFLDYGKQDVAYTPRNHESLVKGIRDYDKFKRVTQFISRYKAGTTTNTSITNVEFIACIIDFKPRPFQQYRNLVSQSGTFADSKPNWAYGLYGREKGSTPKAIADLEQKKEELESLLADFDLEKFENMLNVLAKQQLKLLLEEWKNNELKPFFENLIEERLLKLNMKIQKSRKTYRRFGFFGLLLLSGDKEVLFEEDLLLALKEYQLSYMDHGDVRDLFLEKISDLGN